MTSSSSVVALRQPDTIDDPLTSVLRSGARRLLAQAIEAEADAFLAEMKSTQLPDGRDRVVRHGHGPERQVQIGIGPVTVQRVRLRDRGDGEAAARLRFTSAILPRWARLDAKPGCSAAGPLLARHLDGRLPGGPCSPAGQGRANLSPSAIARLRSDWEADYTRWQRRDLSARRYVYIWADGVYLQARNEAPGRVHSGADRCHTRGQEGAARLQVGMRESAQSWRELLVDLKARGLAIAPELATGDGALGFWKALDEGVADDKASALHGAQGGQRARQAAQVGPARGQVRPARDLGGAGPCDS